MSTASSTRSLAVSSLSVAACWPSRPPPKRAPAHLPSVRCGLRAAAAVVPGQNWNTPDPVVRRAKLTADTLRLLSADAPILARMENMRRATIYAGQDRASPPSCSPPS